MKSISGDNIDFFFSESDINGKYTYASENFVKIDGRSSDELLDTQATTIRHEDVPQYIIDEMYDWSRSKGFWNGILKNINKNGGVYWVKASVIKIHHKGETFFGIISTPATNEEIKKAQKEYNFLKHIRYEASSGRKALLFPIKEAEEKESA
jgi:PAS domain S-box-containing protein